MITLQSHCSYRPIETYYDLLYINNNDDGCVGRTHDLLVKSPRLLRLGRDVYGVTSRVLLMSDLGEGTQISRRQLITYGSNVGAGGGCCI